MSEAASINIVLPPDMAAMVKAKVASGEYASEGEVIQDGLLALQDHDAEVERWLRDEVAGSYDEWKANPERAKPLDEIAARLNVYMDAAVSKAGVT